MSRKHDALGPLSLRRFLTGSEDMAELERGFSCCVYILAFRDISKLLKLETSLQDWHESWTVISNILGILGILGYFGYLGSSSSADRDTM